MDYINSFSEAARTVFTTMLSSEVSRSPRSMAPLCGDTHLDVVIKIAGRVRGRVVLGLSLETAARCTTVLLGGTPDQDEVRDTAGELANMIVGSAASSWGSGVTISCPEIHEVDPASERVLAGDDEVSFSSEIGSFRIVFQLDEAAAAA